MQWVGVLGPLVPVFLHLTKLDQTSVGGLLVRLLPDVVGAIKKAAAPPPEQ